MAGRAAGHGHGLAQRPQVILVDSHGSSETRRVAGSGAGRHSRLPSTGTRRGTTRCPEYRVAVEPGSRGTAELQERFESPLLVVIRLWLGWCC